MKNMLCKMCIVAVLFVSMNSTLYATVHEKYAVIINGVADSDNNKYHYWNECSAMYQTLKANGYLDNHIYVAMSDGTNSAADIWNNQILVSSPLDLDGNHTNDIRFVANYDNIQLIFDSLEYYMTDDDDLFIFVTGKGDTINSHSYLQVWGNGVLMDTTFARMLLPVSARTINIVMAQDYSGGFIDDVRGRENVVITTSCDANEKAFLHTKVDYNEFIFYWLTAVNFFSPMYLYPYYIPYFVRTDMDDDMDGYVSMDEAYVYSTNNSHIYVHPQQESYPACISQALTIGELLEDICGGSSFLYGSDLYIRDNHNDKGDEPNTTTTQSWISEDIWFEQNGSRVYAALQSGETYDVCVRVRNRGNDISNGNATLYVHWAKAVIGGNWPYGWTDDVLYDCDGTYVRMGEMFGQEGLPSIEAGATYVARIPWTTPESEEYSSCIEFSGDNLSELWHYCMLARIVDDDEQPDETTNMALYDFVLNHNNVASRNVTIMDILQNNVSEPHLTGIVGITNPTLWEDGGPYQLVCNVYPGEYWDQTVIVQLTFSERFYENQTLLTWSGCQTNGIDYSFDLGSESHFNNIYFSYGDIGFYPIKLDVLYSNIYEFGEYPEVYVSLALMDSYGVYVGGEEFRFQNGNPESTHIINSAPLPAPRRPINNNIDIEDMSEEVDVYNMQGQRVAHCTYADVLSAALPHGMYILRKHENNQLYQVKIIK